MRGNYCTLDVHADRPCTEGQYESYGKSSNAAALGYEGFIDDTLRGSIFKLGLIFLSKKTDGKTAC